MPADASLRASHGREKKCDRNRVTGYNYKPPGRRFHEPRPL